MPHYIYRIQLAEKYRQEANRDSTFEQTIGEHFNYLKKLKEQGVVWMAGRTDIGLEDPNNFGVCVFEVENKQEALDFTKNDPAVQKGVMEFEIYPFSVVLWKDQ